MLTASLDGNARDSVTDVRSLQALISLENAYGHEALRYTEEEIRARLDILCEGNHTL